jgi:hypothetical protein
MSASPRQQLDRLQRRYRQLAQQIPEIGFILKGSLVQRSSRCGTPTCHCHADPPQLHGPYWHWSTAIDGKTVNRHLSSQQAPLFQQGIDNRKRLESILAQMHELSQQALDVMTNHPSLVTPPPTHTSQAPRRTSSKA